MKVEYFLFWTRFFQTLVTLPLLRGVGSLYCYRCYSHHRTEPPFFSLVILSCSWCLLLTNILFPLHLKCCCLYGAFRKQTSWSVILQVLLVLLQICGLCKGPDVMLCVILLSLSLLKQICFYSCELQERSRLTFFVYKQPHFPTAVCSAVLGRVTFHL